MSNQVKNVLLFLTFCFFLILFYFFSWQVKVEKFDKINFDTTVRVQDNIPRRADSLLEDSAFFASPIMSSIFILLLTGIALVDVRRKKIRWWGLLIPIAFAGLVGVEILGKERVESPAPPFLFIKNPTTHFPKFHVQDGYSYPSGHAGRSLYIAGVFTILIHRIINRRMISMISPILSISYCLIISVGKIYLGHHWLSDIVGGWIVALAFLALVSMRFKTTVV